MTEAKSQKAVLIIAREIFRDEELFETQKALEDAGIETVVASSQLGTCIGKLGATAEATMLVKDINAEDFDAIIFVGGNGARQYYHDSAALTLAKKAIRLGKVVAAICIAPRILANAGLLEDIMVTCYESEADALRELGADFRHTDVTRDGRIVTASGPQASRKFGQTIAQVLAENWVLP